MKLLRIEDFGEVVMVIEPEDAERLAHACAAVADDTAEPLHYRALAAAFEGAAIIGYGITGFGTDAPEPLGLEALADMRRAPDGAETEEEREA